VLRVREMYPEPDGKYINYRPKGRKYDISMIFNIVFITAITVLS
jgi:hypothetical protein